MPSSPLIRLLLLLGFAAGLPGLGLPALALCLLVLVAWYAAVPAVSLRTWGRAIRRMRWFFLTLIVIYAFFTPGTLIGGVHWLPSREGLQLATARALMLVLMLGAVYLLLGTTGRDALAAGLTRLMQLLLPRKIAERLARRLLASLEAVPEMQHAVAASRASGQGGLLDRAAGLIGHIEQQAAVAAEAPHAALPTIRSPSWYEWLWLAGLAAVMLGLAHWNPWVGN